MTSGLEPQILTSSNGPTRGPQAQVLALGAPIAVDRQTFWNSPERPGGAVDSTVDEKLSLVRRWKINSADTWLRVTDRLIRGDHIRSQPAEIALDVRDEILEARGGAYLDVDEWLRAVGAHAETNGWDEVRTDLVMRLAVKAFHAERRLADDDLLPAGERVVTMFAHDLATAVYLTQAGARLGYAAASTVAEMLDAIAHNAAVYPSWASFAAAYVLSDSVLRGGYPVDAVYTSAASACTLLLTDTASPWTNVGYPGQAAPHGDAGPR